MSRRREQILTAVVSLVAEGNYESTSIEEIAGRSGVSKDEFVSEFADKKSCLLAVYDGLVDELIGHVDKAFMATENLSWPDRVSAALEAALDLVAANPEAAETAVLALPPLGPEAHSRYRLTIDRLRPYLQDGSVYVNPAVEVPSYADLMAIGGAEAIIFDEIAAGRTRQLPSMLPSILFAVLLPYLGPEEAAAHMQQISHVG